MSAGFPGAAFACLAAGDRAQAARHWAAWALAEPDLEARMDRIDDWDLLVHHRADLQALTEQQLLGGFLHDAAMRWIRVRAASKDPQEAYLGLQRLADAAAPAEVSEFVPRILELLSKPGTLPPAVVYERLVPRLLAVAPEAFEGIRPGLLKERSARRTALAVALLNSPAGRRDLDAGLLAVRGILAGLLDKGARPAYKVTTGFEEIVEAAGTVGHWANLRPAEAESIVEFYAETLDLLRPLHSDFTSTVARHAMVFAATLDLHAGLERQATRIRDAVSAQAPGVVQSRHLPPGTVLPKEPSVIRVALVHSRLGLARRWAGRKLDAEAKAIVAETVAEARLLASAPVVPELKETLAHHLCAGGKGLVDEGRPDFAAPLWPEALAVLRTAAASKPDLHWAAWITETATKGQAGELAPPKPRRVRGKASAD